MMKTSAWIPVTVSHPFQSDRTKAQIVCPTPGVEIPIVMQYTEIRVRIRLCAGSVCPKAVDD